jgi:hypothetical protein
MGQHAESPGVWAVYLVSEHSAPLYAPPLGKYASRRKLRNVCFWHKADIHLCVRNPLQPI